MRNRILLAAATLAVIVVVWILVPVRKTATPGGPPTDIIKSTGGNLRGFLTNGLNVYLGIPYAQAPGGELRFKPPVARQPWQGTLDAYDFGAFCPQSYDALVVDDPKEDLNNENCLTLNIWSPAAPSGKKAVMVFIHGGGFVQGSSKELLYHGDALAKMGNVIVVTLNYRVGLLGFFDFSVIAGKDYANSADIGMQDQIMGLRWVKENIAAFGGDPQNITVFGESAGGGSVLALLGMDAPQQYFNRAIVMSGSPLHSATNARDIANLLVKQTNLSWPQLWKSMPSGILMFVQQKVMDAVGSPISDLVFAPAYGSNFVIKRSPQEAVAAGNARGIDLMIGNMADEMSYWSFYDTPTSHICEQTIKDNLFTSIDPNIQPHIQTLFDLYASNPLRAGKKAGDIILAIGDDYAFRTQALNVASQQASQANTYYYRVDYPVNLPDQPCQNNRSPHGAELPFVFGKIDEKTGYDFIGKPRDAADEASRKQLMKQMIEAWTNFAKTGNPNGPDLPTWPAFDAATRPTMIFSDNLHVINAPFDAEYHAMNDFMKTFSVFDALK